MRILFVYSLEEIESPDKPLQWPGQEQFGISYISSVLKKNGHLTRLAVLCRALGKKNITILGRHIKDFNPRLICFTAVSSEYKFISTIANRIKSEYKDIYLLIGGVHASLNPEEVLTDSFDALCIGEGEYPVLELVSQIENDVRPSGIRNLWIKHGLAVERNATRPFLENLDILPFPDRGMWQGLIEDRLNLRQVVLLGRGCPFECTYCSNHALKKLASGRYVRLRSASSIVEEIKSITKMFPGHNEVYLEVETFCADKDWAITLCLELQRLNETLKNPLSFGVNLRIVPGSDYEDVFAACKRSNFRFINIGLESGSERLRRQVLKRNYSNEDVINAVQTARRYGLEVCFFNLIGVPGETLADFRETLKMNRLCLPDWHFTSIFFPYQGTELYSVCKSKGLLDRGLDTRMEREKAVLDLPGFSKRQIQKAYDWFDYHIYAGYKPRGMLLYKTIYYKLRLKPKLFYLYSIARKICHMFGVDRAVKAAIVKIFSYI